MQNNKGCWFVVMNMLGLALLIPTIICIALLFNGCGTDDSEHEITALSVAPTSSIKVCPVDWADVVVACEVLY